MIFAWLKAFLFTQIVEIPIYRYGLRCSYLRAFGASAITHPIVWFVAAASGWHAAWWIRAACGETFAFLVEAAYFALSFGWKRGLAWSAIANGTSFVLGLIALSL